MLAVLGFVTAGILFGLFALSFESITNKKLEPTLKKFALAYYILSAVFLVFGVASGIGNKGVLGITVILGHLLLLIATVPILQIFLEGSPRRKQLVYGAVGLGLALLLARVLFFYPAPYMTDGILFFNSPPLVSFILAAVFLLIWLPVNLRVSQLVSAKVPSLMITNAFLYVGAALSVTLFLLARTPLTVVMSFTPLAIAFLMLIFSNAYIEAEKGAHHAK